MKGVIYARYSSDNQREESIEGQIRDNRAFAERNGIEIVGRFRTDHSVEMVSGLALFTHER